MHLASHTPTIGPPDELVPNSRTDELMHERPADGVSRNVRPDQVIRCTESHDVADFCQPRV
jgi:hypothetical protein